MFRNAGLLLRSVALSLALASVFACAAEDTSEQQGSSGSELSKGNKRPLADASAGDSDGGFDPDASVGDTDASVGDWDAGYEDNDASVDGYPDGGAVADASVR